LEPAAASEEAARAGLSVIATSTCADAAGMVTVLRPITWFQPGWASTLIVASWTVWLVQRSTELSVQLTGRRDLAGCSATCTVIVQADAGAQPDTSSETESTSPALAGGRSASAESGAVVTGAGGGSAGAIPGPGGMVPATPGAVAGSGGAAWVVGALAGGGAAGAVPGAAGTATIGVVTGTSPNYGRPGAAGAGAAGAGLDCVGAGLSCAGARL
jgi:hypothetical protein